jgi:hypothetical protein
MPPNGPRSTNKEMEQMAKFAIGFKYDEAINDHKVINEGQLGRV